MKRQWGVVLACVVVVGIGVAAAGAGLGTQKKPVVVEWSVRIIDADGTFMVYVDPGIPASGKVMAFHRRNPGAIERLIQRMQGVWAEEGGLTDLALANLQLQADLNREFGGALAGTDVDSGQISRIAVGTYGVEDLRGVPPVRKGWYKGPDAPDPGTESGGINGTTQCGDAEPGCNGGAYCPGGCPTGCSPPATQCTTVHPKPS